jgi:hypothetical protein
MPNEPNRASLMTTTSHNLFMPSPTLPPVPYQGSSAAPLPVQQSSTSANVVGSYPWSESPDGVGSPSSPPLPPLPPPPPHEPSGMPNMPKSPSPPQGAQSALEELERQQQELQKRLNDICLRRESLVGQIKPTLTITLQNQLHHIRFHTPRFFTIRNGAVPSPLTALEPNGTATGLVELSTLTTDESVDGCIMYLIEDAIPQQTPLSQDTFFVFGWMFTSMLQRKYFASVAHIPGTMNQIPVPAPDGSQEHSFLIDILIADDKARRELFAQLSKRRMYEAGKQMRQAFSLMHRNPIGIKANMNASGEPCLEISLWLSSNKSPVKNAMSSEPTSSRPSIDDLNTNASAASKPVLVSRSRHNSIAAQGSRSAATEGSIPSPTRSPPMPLISRSRHIPESPRFSPVSELGRTRSPLPASSSTSPTLRPSTSSSNMPFSMIFNIDQRHPKVSLQLLCRHDTCGTCETPPLDTLNYGAESLTKFYNTVSQENGPSVEGWAVYTLNSTSYAEAQNHIYCCLVFSWRALPDRQHCQYATAMVYLDGDEILMTEDGWARFVHKLTNHVGWSNIGCATKKMYMLAQDDLNVRLEANMLMAPMIVLRAELSEWTDTELKVGSTDRDRPNSNPALF